MVLVLYATDFLFERNYSMEKELVLIIGQGRSPVRVCLFNDALAVLHCLTEGHNDLRSGGVSCRKICISDKDI